MILLRLFFQTVFLALGQIWANKVRSMLTTLGVIIGVAAVVATVAAVNGLRQYVLSEFETFGAKKVYVDGRVPQDQRNKISWRDVQLTEDEVDALVERAPSITKINPHWYGRYDIGYGPTVINSVSVVGIWPEWHDIENRFVVQGRLISRLDNDQRLQVCVINEKAVEELDMPTEPAGAFIHIGGRRFKVVGLLEEKELGPMFGGGETQAEVYIPFSTAQNLNANGWLNYAMGEMEDPKKVEDVKAEMRGILRRMRNLDPDDEDTFEIFVMQQMINQFNNMAAAIGAGAGGIVAISLLVGGIGIMNIMLVSVSERTREIGLRKAVGAKPTVILLQFLVEAVVLCLVGAGLGLLLGQIIVLGLQNIPNFPLEGASIPLWAVILSAGFSAATGIIFGMFPAIKAARLDPIEALRHE